MTNVLARVKAVLASTATRWLTMTEILPVDLLSHPPATGEWSATECLIHLLDTEHIFPARVQALLAGQAIPAFDPDTQGTKDTTSSPEKLAAELVGLRQVSTKLCIHLGAPLSSVVMPVYALVALPRVPMKWSRSRKCTGDTSFLVLKTYPDWKTHSNRCDRVVMSFPQERLAPFLDVPPTYVTRNGEQTR